MTTPLTFDEYAELEPRLSELMRKAKSERHTPDQPYCANAVWYGYGSRPSMKEAVCELVGWEREDISDPRLCGREAFDVCYQAIYDALPDCCGRCSCSCFY